MSDEPQDDVTYNVVIGETVTGGGDEHYHVLQYGFKPASIDGSQEGLLRKTENGGVEVEFANPGKVAGDKAYFKGQYTPCKEYDCILIFDSKENTFRLERLMGLGKSLKVVRKDQTRYTTPRMETPMEQETFEAPPPTTTTVAAPPPRPRNAKRVAELPPATNVSGSSPEDGSLSEGAAPAKRGRNTRKPAGSVAKRPRKSAAAGRAAKDVKAPEPVEEPPETDDFLEDLVDQIESGMPTDSAKPASQDEEGEPEDDFLAAAFESENTYQPPAVDPPIQSPPLLPLPSSFPSSSHPPSSTHRPHPPPIPPPPKPASTLHAHNLPHPAHPPSSHAGTSTFGFPANQNSNPAQSGVAQVQANGAPKANGAEESDSGSDSESASESESASDSASESSSESESENE